MPRLPLAARPGSSLGLFLMFMSLGLASPATSESRAAESPVDFNRDIRPILSNNCFHCHGPDAKERKGGGDHGLRLDTAAGLTADLGGHFAVVAGSPDKSELWRRVVSQDADEAMPPPATGKKLSQRETALLRQWIEQGAPYANHWSYVKPKRPAIPKVQGAAWPKNDVDRFLLARLEREKLAPAPEADRHALIRRLTLDLTGLPPTPAEVAQFVGDADPRAYEHLVDRLLKKEAYGEHWAHMWLDLARYADSAGYADDPARTIWLYRDYVIRSLNANKPFDRFTIEQIAGDLLPAPTSDDLIATAFHRNTLTNNEGGTNDEEFRNVAVVDRVNTTMAVWMGTTIACAQCHNHKYDPISQEEFFRLFAFFNNSEDADRRDESPLHANYSESQQRQRTAWQEEIATLESSLRASTPELDAAQAAWERAFPLEPAWRSVKPAAVKTQSAVAAVIDDAGEVATKAGAKTDVYTVEAPLDAGPLRAVRLDALPDDSLPGKGPGHAGGAFIVTRMTASISPPQGRRPKGRYVRIELPGKAMFLSLAEVQVFSGGENIAVRGEASQISTDFDGPAKLAIDGNTNGHYFDARSTTHTAAATDPWWEVDLKSEQPIDRIVVWNRTDGGANGRLKGFHVRLLDALREPVWQKTEPTAPSPSVELPLSGERPLEFAVALADYVQNGYDVATVIAPVDAKKDPKKNPRGWAIGGQTGRPHWLTLVAASPIQVVAGSTLTVTIEQTAAAAHQTLGRFRLSTSGEAQIEDWARTPAPIVAALKTPAASRTDEQRKQLTEHFRQIAPSLQPVRQKLAAVQKQLADLKPETVPIMRDLPQEKRRVTRLQHRGNYLDQGDEVTEGTPAAFPPLPADAPRNRLALARWLVDENNPLTARVIANRFWEQLFGVGIVATSEEFGAQGDQPFHPELLDYLATELTRMQWDMKSFVRLLVTSAAYRQSSRVSEELQQRDPDNRLLARGPRFRMSAETIRDQALFVGGLLSSKMYGPPVKPPQPSIGLNAAFGAGIDWQTSMGDDRYRRGLYTTWRRSNPYPSMATFDAPNREVCTVRRIRTNTPLQALVTLNDPVYVEAAQALARRVVREAPASESPAERAAYAFRLCLSRPPSEQELRRLVQLYEQSLGRFEKSPEEARRMATEPLGAAPSEMNVAQLAAWTVVGNVLLNLDETLMKR